VEALKDIQTRYRASQLIEIVHGFDGQATLTAGGHEYCARVLRFGHLIVELEIDSAFTEALGFGYRRFHNAGNVIFTVLAAQRSGDAGPAKYFTLENCRRASATRVIVILRRC
jgi:hypothetical protein